MKNDVGYVVGELLSGYVTHGSMREDGLFDKDFDRLRELAPRSSAAPSTLWRVIVVTTEMAEALLGGETVSLSPRRFGSWTKSHAAIAPLLRKRVVNMSADQVALTVQKPLPQEVWALDVEQTYLDLGWNHPDVTEWQQYVVWEREMIVAQTPELLTIAPKDVLSVHGRLDTALKRPSVGETCWTAGYFSRPEMRHVPEDQPDAEEGIYVVVTADGTERVRWNDTECAWDPIDGIDYEDDPIPTWP